jgi:hypothetical protein
MDKSDKKPVTVIAHHLKSQMLYSGVKKIQDNFLKEIEKEYTKPIKKEMKDLFKKVNPNKDDIKFFGRYFKGQVFPDAKHIINQITNDALQNEIIRKYSESNTMVIYLSEDGDLYLDPKDEYCYPVKKGSLRHKIIRILKDQDNSYSTQEIRKDSGAKEARAVRDAILEINKKAEELLSIQDTDTKKLIVNRGDGYQVNKLYYIFEK